MNSSIEIFFPISSDCIDIERVKNIAQCQRVAGVHLWIPKGFSTQMQLHDKVRCLETESLVSSAPFLQMAQCASADYVVCVLKELPQMPDAEALLTMCDAMLPDASMLYADYYKMINGER